ncbi:solute carrier family 22 member 6-A-like isoform X1 [Hemitrygon akajei]|uniref:solute carrier family 22 member 6-A-like isoform X1 n=1 Tax=Hemitrygon akajei TaxID=2704970 RepID=UPI003BF9958E
MGFADILEIVGSQGKFQAIQIFLMTFPTLFMPCLNLLQNFIAIVPDHRCRVQLGGEGLRYLNVTEEPLREEFLRVFLPMDREGRPDKCRMYTSPQWHLLGTNETQGNGSQPETQACTDGWVYDNAQFRSTIVTEWDLVCEWKSLKRMVQSIYMMGLMIGASVMGRMADKYGRRTILLWSSFQLAVCGTCGMLSPSLTLFCFWRFLCGTAMAGIISNTYFFTIEWIPKRINTVVVTTLNYVYSLGMMLLAGTAFWIQDWRRLQLVVSIPFIVIFLYSWWLPESARWLLMNNKTNAAAKQLRKVAKLNGKEADGEKITTELLISTMEEDLTNSKDSYSVLDLFRTPGLCKISCCIMFVWFSISFSYYGLAVDLQRYGMNIYLIQVIFSAIDIPAISITYILMRYVGRCFTECVSLILAGSIIFINIFIPTEMQTLRSLLTAVGTGSISAAFCCLFLHTPELFPTVIRQTGMGLALTMARVGAIISPIVRLIDDYIPFFTMTLYGGMAIMSGIVAFTLLETRNVPLPDTIEEVERRVKKRANKIKRSNKEEIQLREA